MTGMFMAAQAQAAVVAQLNREVVRVVNSPAVKEKVFAVGVETVGRSPEELASAMRSDMTSLGKVIKDAGIPDE